MYNIAQVLAGADDGGRRRTRRSLFGRRLWAETRIALFQQAVDTRSRTHHLRETEARVSFGTRWVRGVGRSRSSRRTSRASARSSAPTSTRIRWPSSTRGEVPAAQGAAPAQRHDLPLEPRLLRHHRAASRTCASRTASCRRGRASLDEIANARVLVRADGRARRARARTSPSASTSTRPARTSTPRRARASARTSRGSTARTSPRATLVLDRAAAARRGRASRRQGVDDERHQALPRRRRRSACAPAAPARAGCCRRGTRCKRSRRRRASARTRWSPRPCSASRPAARSRSGSARASTRPSVARAQLPARRAVHDDRPLHRARRRSGRDGREPDDLGAHPPRPRRGQGPSPRRAGHATARCCASCSSGGSHARDTPVVDDHEARRRPRSTPETATLEAIG